MNAKEWLEEFAFSQSAESMKAVPLSIAIEYGERIRAEVVEACQMIEIEGTHITPIYRCSQCSHAISGKVKYCPNCGRKVVK